MGLEGSLLQSLNQFWQATHVCVVWLHRTLRCPFASLGLQVPGSVRVTPLPSVAAVTWLVQSSLLQHSLQAWLLLVAGHAAGDVAATQIAHVKHAVAFIRVLAIPIRGTVRRAVQERVVTTARTWAYYISQTTARYYAQ